jgi:hypothetical protein
VVERPVDELVALDDSTRKNGKEKHDKYHFKDLNTSLQPEKHRSINQSINQSSINPESTKDANVIIKHTALHCTALHCTW